ncbi:hypothetical protein GCM10027168_61980 [Streptomyces capparidis]
MSAVSSGRAGRAELLPVEGVGGGPAGRVPGQPNVTPPALTGKVRKSPSRTSTTVPRKGVDDHSAGGTVEPARGGRARVARPAGRPAGDPSRSGRRTRVGVERSGGPRGPVG